MPYIYALTDPRTKAVHYVGKTNGSLRKRLNEHTSTPTSRQMRAWVLELAGLRLRPMIQLLEEVDPSLVDWRENYWMAVMAYQGEYLFNGITNEYMAAAYIDGVWRHPDPLPDVQ